METKKVVFNDEYGVLAIASAPEITEIENDNSLTWSGSTLKQELTQYIKNLRYKKRFRAPPPRI